MKFYLLIILCSVSFQLFSQVIESKILKEKRAILLLNIAEETKGFRYGGYSFKIAVVEDLSLVNTLTDISYERKVNGKRILIENIRSLPYRKKYDLVYVNKNNFKTNIPRFLEFVKKRKTLLITENYPISKTTIGLTVYQDSFGVDINIDNLKKCGFIPSKNLIKTSLKSSSKLKEYYKNQKQKDEKEKGLLAYEKSSLETEKKALKGAIAVKSRLLRKKNRGLYKLKKTIDSQEEKYNEQLDSLDILRQNLLNQECLIEVTTEELKIRNAEIRKKNLHLEDLELKIAQKQRVLEKQTYKLSVQKLVNLLLVGIVLLGLGFLLYVIKTSNQRKKLVKRLKQNNMIIAKNSKTLERQNKELEQFAFIASHDLQEPLHTITSFSNFMYEDYHDKLDETALENLGYIKEGCRRMGNLINSLLDYSRIGAQRKLKKFHTKEILEDIVQDFHIKIKETNTTIVYGDLPEIYGYMTELRLLFQNLISNAIKFKKEGVNPNIHISGEVLENCIDYSHCWHFKIKDNGIGIAEEHQKKVFDIFQRLHNREAYEGAGIGLAHCKKIVSFHHGELWIESVLGEGTTVHFTVKFNV